MKAHSRLLVATLAGAMMSFTFAGCSSNDKVSLASAQIAVPTAIPTAAAEVLEVLCQKLGCKEKDNKINLRKQEKSRQAKETLLRDLMA